MSPRNAISAIVVLAALGAAPLAAQDRSAATATELDAAVAGRSAQRIDNQKTLVRFLETERVRSTASAMGTESADLTARVGMLDDGTLARIADMARREDERVLAGGDTIIISTTAVIIGLLILILITD